MELSLPNLALVLAVAAQTAFQAALTRLFRLLKNPRFDPEIVLRQRLIALEEKGRLTGVEIVVDWTSCGLFQVLYAALVLEEADAHCGRAMLLNADSLSAGEAHRKGTLEGKMNQIEATFLQRIKRAFAETALETGEPNRFAQALFVFDRGFYADRTSAKDAYLGFLHRERFRFVVRAKIKVRCLTQQGHSIRLDKYARRLRSGTIVKGLIYKHKAKEPRPRVNLVVRKRHIKGKWHTWIGDALSPVFTNLDYSEQAALAYERRFTIEESFKDIKTHWRIETRRFKHEDRLSRYLALLSLVQSQLCAVALALLAGAEHLRKQLGESGRNKLSLPNVVRRAAFLRPDLLHNTALSSWCI